MSELFRREAVDHQRQRFHGAIVLTRTWSYAALTVFLCGIVLALIAFSVRFGFTRKETVNGMVVPDRGLIRVAASQSGVITRIDVTEGQQVRAGDPLFLLSGERTSAQGDTQANINETLMARIARLRGELEQQDHQTHNKSREFDLRVANLASSVHKIDNELLAQRRRVQIVRENAENIADLAKSGAVSKATANDRAAELIEQESRLSGLERERLVLQREIATLEAGRIDLPLQAQREASELKRSIEELKQQITESEVKRQVVVRADQAGRVAGIVVDRGQAVVVDQRLASVLPEGSSLEVELYAPTRAVGFVHPGTQVLLRYEAFPYQKFGQFPGQVREVSLSTIPLSELQLNGAVSGSQPGSAGVNTNEPVYRIRVRLESQDVVAFGRAHMLKPGMQLAASLVLEHRTLAEWALEPMYGMTGRL
ncbi:MAG: HlyD family efflux transporter periplasmic adaptor subunit [Pseudomonadota bacterium]